MFTFPSLTKILVLATILLAVWFGFRLLGQLDRARKEEARLNQGGGRRRWAARGAGKAKSADIQDMMKCSACGAYVPSAGATACGRTDCPY
ncbi:hypothetical protein [Rhodospirillaceae bacterium SYSU D60014]|uniref:hypothetical protein n=1 Tax=Virgifigura deserti TaxID=2268457 RepID=UPI000E661460